MAKKALSTAGDASAAPVPLPSTPTPVASSGTISPLQAALRKGPQPAGDPQESFDAFLIRARCEWVGKRHWVVDQIRLAMVEELEKARDKHNSGEAEAITRALEGLHRTRKGFLPVANCKGFADHAQADWTKAKAAGTAATLSPVPIEGKWSGFVDMLYMMSDTEIKDLVADFVAKLEPCDSEFQTRLDVALEKALERHKAGGKDRAAKKPKPRKTRRKAADKPITARQLEAVETVGRCHSFAEAARQMKRNGRPVPHRSTIRQHYLAGMAKLQKVGVRQPSKGVPKPSTGKLPAGRRGQANIADGEDRRS